MCFCGSNFSQFLSFLSPNIDRILGFCNFSDGKSLVPGFFYICQPLHDLFLFCGSR